MTFSLHSYTKLQHLKRCSAPEGGPPPVIRSEATHLKLHFLFSCQCSVIISKILFTRHLISVTTNRKYTLEVIQYSDSNFVDIFPWLCYEAESTVEQNCIFSFLAAVPLKSCIITVSSIKKTFSVSIQEIYCNLLASSNLKILILLYTFHSWFCYCSFQGRCARGQTICSCDFSFQAKTV